MCLFQSTSNVITASGQLQLISCNKPTVMCRHSLSHHATPPSCPLPRSPRTSTPVTVLRWLHVSLTPNEVSCHRHYKLNHFTGREEVSDLFFFKSGYNRNNSGFHSGPCPRVDCHQAGFHPQSRNIRLIGIQVVVVGGGGCIIEAVLAISGLR